MRRRSTLGNSFVDYIVSTTNEYTYGSKTYNPSSVNVYFAGFYKNMYEQASCFYYRITPTVSYSISYTCNKKSYRVDTWASGKVERTYIGSTTETSSENTYPTGTTLDTKNYCQAGCYYQDAQPTVSVGQTLASSTMSDTSRGVYLPYKVTVLSISKATVTLQISCEGKTGTTSFNCQEGE